MGIYYMLGHRGWVQSSNGVSANTHKEFTLEILMTMAPILDGVPSLSFHLEGVEQVVPYEYIRELLGFHKELALLGFDCQVANRLHSPYDQSMVL
jgi:hypothetical protein